MDRSVAFQEGKRPGLCRFRSVGKSPARSLLDELVREGAQKMLQVALDAEVHAFPERFQSQRDEQGHQRVVRNGYLPERTILTGVGPIDVRQPRVWDRGAPGEEEGKLSSAIFPPYLRRSKAIDELIPWLYLKGISTGDFGEALQALLGPERAGQDGQECEAASESGLA